MVVRELVAVLGIKTDPKGQKAAENGMNKLVSLAKKGVAAFLAFKGLKVFKSLIQGVAEVGDMFDKMAQRSGVAFEALQGLGHAAALSGASISDVETSIKKLQASQVEAADGVATYSDEFKRLGIEVKDSKGNLKDTTDLLIEMADGMQGLETDAERTAVSMKLLGRGGTNLIPLMKGGSEAVREMMSEVRDLGGIMDGELRQNSIDFIDNQQRMTVMFQGIRNTIAKEVLPFFIKMQEATIAWWKANREWISQNIGPIFAAIGRVVRGVVGGFSALVGLIMDFVGQMSPMQKGILAIVAGIEILAAILNTGPLGMLLLLIGLIALVIEDWVVFREGGESAIGAIIDMLSDLLGVDVLAWLQEIGDKFGSVFGEVFDVVSSVMGAILETFFATISLMFGLLDDPAAAWEAFTNEMGLIWGELWEEIGGSVDKWIGGFKGALTLLLGWLGENFLFPVIDSFFEFQTSITQLFDDIGQTIRLWAASMVETVKSPFKAAKNALSTLFGDGPKKPSLGVGSAVTGAVAQNIVNAPRTEISVRVEGSPNANETATRVTDKIRAEMDRRNRSAMKALAAVAPGAGG